MKNKNNPLKHKEESCVSLVERTVGLEVKRAYSNLKSVFVEKNCRITSEEAPVFISVRHGSIWGISPANAKKNVESRLTSVASGTRITCSSSLASDWKNLTLVGCLLAVVVLVLCLWMTVDLNVLVATQQQGYWSWIARVDGYIDIQTAEMMAGLTQMLAFFLSIILIAEVVIVVYVNFSIDSFAEEALNDLRERSLKPLFNKNNI